MYVANPWKSYKEISTQTAPPGQLVLMLFDAALRALERSLTGFSLVDHAERNMCIHNNIQRAQDIVQELNLSLDMEQGGDCAVTLRRLYAYFKRRLWESDLKKNSDGIQEVIRHMTVLRDAWATMLNNGAAADQAREMVPASMQA
jgi:flagellar secretion chaperone FliS